MKYRQMQAQLNAVSDEKLKIEYDYGRRLDLANSRIDELTRELNGVNDEFSSKLTQNKSFFNDLNRLNAELDRKNAEIEELKSRIAVDNDSSAKQTLEIRSCYSQINELQDSKNMLQMKNDKLTEDNYSLNNFNRELESKIKMLESEAFRSSKRAEEVEFELKNTLGKLRHKEENAEFSNRQLGELQTNLSKVQDNYRNAQLEVDRLRGEIQDLTISKQRETQANKEMESMVSTANRRADEKERELGRILTDLEGSKGKNDKLIEDNTRLFSEIERLKNHIVVLNEQNSRLTQELDVIGDQDERIREKLSRKERINNLIMSNKTTLETSLKNYDHSR